MRNIVPANVGSGHIGVGRCCRPENKRCAGVTLLVSLSDTFYQPCDARLKLRTTALNARPPYRPAKITHQRPRLSHGGVSREVRTTIDHPMSAMTKPTITR